VYLFGNVGRAGTRRPCGVSISWASERELDAGRSSERHGRKTLLRKSESIFCSIGLGPVRGGHYPSARALCTRRATGALGAESYGCGRIPHAADHERRGSKQDGTPGPRARQKREHPATIRQPKRPSRAPGRGGEQSTADRAGASRRREDGPARRPSQRTATSSGWWRPRRRGRSEMSAGKDKSAAPRTLQQTHDESGRAGDPGLRSRRGPDRSPDDASGTSRAKRAARARARAQEESAARLKHSRARSSRGGGRRAAA